MGSLHPPPNPNSPRVSPGGVRGPEARDPASGGGHAVPEQPAGGRGAPEGDRGAAAGGGPGDHQDGARAQGLPEEGAVPLHDYRGLPVPQVREVGQ